MSLLCQRRSYVREGVFSVLACERGSAPNIFQVQLSDTVLFPGGGGQPSDTGTVAGRRVASVVRDVATGAVWHHVLSEAPLALHSRVPVQVDWTRRWDHMVHHSAQHLLSAVAQNDFALTTVSWRLAPFPRPCAVELETASFSSDDMQRLESLVNEKIRANVPVKVHYFQSAAEALEHSALESSALPFQHDFDAEPLRAVEFENIDFNPCCGTHVLSSGELQLVKLVGQDRAHGHVLVKFIAGGRCLKALEDMVHRDQRLNDILSVGPEEHVEAVSKLQHRLRRMDQANRGLNEEVAEMKGHSLATDALTSGRKFVDYQREDGTMAFLQSVAKSFKSVAPNVFLLLSCGDFRGGAGQILVVGPNSSAVKQIGQHLILPDLLGGRGGGRPGTFQAKVTQLQRWRQAVSSVQEQGLIEVL